MKTAGRETRRRFLMGARCQGEELRRCSRAAAFRSMVEALMCQLRFQLEEEMELESNLVKDQA